MQIRQTGIVLFTEHYDRAVEFYETVLGLEVLERQNEVTVFAFGQGYLMVEKNGFAAASEKDRRQNPTVLRLDVSDFAISVNRLRNQNIEVRVDAYDWGRIAILVDTEGNRIELKDASFPHRVPTLVGASLTLREPHESDIPGWYLRATDAESALLAGDSIPGSIEEGAAWLEGLRRRFAEGRALRWAIVPGEEPSIGTVGLTLADDPGGAELSIVLARSHWGCGLGSAAVGLVLDYAFQTLGLAAVDAEVLETNTACIRLLERQRFALVDTFTEQLPSDPRPVEVCRYRLTSVNRRV